MNSIDIEITKEIIKPIISWLVPFILGALVTYIQRLKKKNSSIEDGVQCLLRQEIIRCHDTYVSAGTITLAQREALDRLYKAYHNLGGNDVASEMYKECGEIRIKE